MVKLAAMPHLSRKLTITILYIYTSRMQQINHLNTRVPIIQVVMMAGMEVIAKKIRP
jgi:hypothetical protein